MKGSTLRKQRTSQVLANPENNDPLILETSKLLNKFHTDPRFINNNYLTFLFIALKVQDIQYLFSKSIPFTFFAILSFEFPCGVHILALQKQRASESCDSRRVLNPKVTRDVTFGTLRYCKYKRNKKLINAKIKGKKKLLMIKTHESARMILVFDTFSMVNFVFPPFPAIRPIARER